MTTKTDTQPTDSIEVNKAAGGDCVSRLVLPLGGPWRAFPASKPHARTRDYPESERYSMYAHWKIADDDQSAGNDMCRGNLVAHIYNHNGNVEANARVIAAAPRMLVALQMAKEEFEKRDGAGTCPTEIEELLEELSWQNDRTLATQPAKEDSDSK